MSAREEPSVRGTAACVFVVLPNDIDDPAAPSGGNGYDRQLCLGLSAAGWSVRERAVVGAWPRPSAGEKARLARLLASLPDHAVVLLDGLVASAAPEVLVGERDRLRLVVLVHLALADPGEQQALSAAVAVIVTSRWSRQHLLDLYPLPPDRVHVALPGVIEAAAALPSPAGSRLLCVAAVAPHKGHDILVEALAAVAELDWDCTLVGSLDRDPGFVTGIRAHLDRVGLDDRVHLVGTRTGPELDAHFAGADLFVLASRGETFGMVVVEALARGLPVLATAVNGLPEAMGRAPDGRRPGLLVGPDDPVALAGALRRWLTESELRQRLRGAAAARRNTLTGWADTARAVSRVLAGTRAMARVGR